MSRVPRILRFRLLLLMFSSEANISTLKELLSIFLRTASFSFAKKSVSAVLIDTVSDPTQGDCAKAFFTSSRWRNRVATVSAK